MIKTKLLNKCWFGMLFLILNFLLGVNYSQTANKSFINLNSNNGRINGFNTFNPDSLNFSIDTPMVYLTDIKTYKSSVNIYTDESFLDKHTNEMGTINLHYKDNAITLNFAAVNYSHSKQIEYAYKLEGFDKSWSCFGSQQFATYTNIPPGDYKFLVKTKILEIEFDEKRLVDIDIAPPFWYNYWFWIIIGVLIFMGIIIAIKKREEALIRKQIKLKQIIEKRTKKINKQNKKIQAQNIRLEELNKTKDKLYQVIAHDLKSPFNSIIGFTQLLQQNHKKWPEHKVTEFVNIMHDSTVKIYNLLDNLLIWARTQNENIDFVPKSINLIELLDNNIALLKDIANEKSIQINLLTKGNINVEIDETMISTVVRNIVTNSIKFTRSGGEIQISCFKEDDKVILVFKDDGVGIPEKSKLKVLDIDILSTEGTNEEKGTGLGLLICKEFVQIHKGEIWFESEENKGTTFFVSLPERQIK